MAAAGSYAYRVEAGKCVQYYSNEEGGASVLFTSANSLVPADLQSTACFQDGVYFLTSGGNLCRMKLGEEAVTVAGPFANLKAQARLYASVDGAYCYVVCTNRIYRYRTSDGTTSYQSTPTNVLYPEEPGDGFGNGSGYDEIVWVVPRSDGSAQIFATDQYIGGVQTASMSFATTSAPTAVSAFADGGGSDYTATINDFYAWLYSDTLGYSRWVRFSDTAVATEVAGSPSGGTTIVSGADGQRWEPFVVRHNPSPFTFWEMTADGYTQRAAQYDYRYLSSTHSYGAQAGVASFDFVVYPDITAAPITMFSFGGRTYTPQDGFAAIRIAPVPPTAFWTSYVGSTETV